MEAVDELSQNHGVQEACAALGIARSALYRARQVAAAPSVAALPKARSSRRGLSNDERAKVREVLNSEPFQDQAPREVYASLLDQGIYLCHWRTMYRILDAHGEVRERRNQLRHPSYSKPELLATGPNQLWSWDITKLLGPTKWTYFYLYVILDVYSRYVVGWMIAERESAELAEQLITETCAKQGIEPDQLTIHADRGSAMTSKSVALLLADLGVTKTHSRPHVSDDNPFSEAQFKTLKYRPDYPGRFGCLVDARIWARAFFDWYNNDHHHSALALLTPADVHSGWANERLEQRQAVLHQAYAAHPERFVHGAPVTPAPPAAVWINPPAAQPTGAFHSSEGRPSGGASLPMCNDGSGVLATKPDPDYTPLAGAEDRATLRSDPSADAGDGADGQGFTNPAHSIQINQLHCPQSDKPTDLAAANLTLIAASLHHRHAGSFSTQHSHTKFSQTLSHDY
jgi:putative transposase